MTQLENVVTAPLTNKLIDWNISRDSFIWFWGRISTGALLIASGIVPLEQYVGGWSKAIQIVAVIILWLSGKYDSSPLPGAKK
jgi:hypothetical protein